MNNVTTSVSLQTEPLIHKNIDPALIASSVEEDSLPVAAIVSIGLGLYVVLMFIIFAVIRCYCGKQCSDIECTCSCCPFLKKNEQCCGPQAIKIITCSCCQCDNVCLPPKTDVDFVGIILCEKCLGPNGACAQYYNATHGINITPQPICECDNCDSCNCECNLDCETINCLCFQIHNRGTGHDGYNNNYSNNASTEPIKMSPVPSTGRSIDSFYPGSSQTMISPINTVRSCEVDVKSTQTPRDMYSGIILDSSEVKPTKGIAKSSIVPQSDTQLFKPRNATAYQNKTPKSTIAGKKKGSLGSGKKEYNKKISETKVETFSNKQYSNASCQSHQDLSPSSPSATNPDLKLKNTTGTNLSQSATISSNSSSTPRLALSSTTEALLAQYQSMDASNLSNASVKQK